MNLSIYKSNSKNFEHDKDLCNNVLAAYFEHTRYLKTAKVSKLEENELTNRVSSICSFSIPESCYINDTGHFNSVEFNICYNQMMYYTIACATKNNLMGLVDDWSMDDFFKKQLPDILIVNFQSKFKRPVNAREFTGEIEFLSSKLVRRGKPVLYIKTNCQFYDENNGFCSGSVDLAIVEPMATKEKRVEESV